MYNFVNHNMPNMSSTSEVHNAVEQYLKEAHNATYQPMNKNGELFLNFKSKDDYIEFVLRWS
jgi:hypothetical protein